MSILDFGPLGSLPTPHFKMAPGRDVRDFLTAYAMAGGPHHSAVCLGDARPRLRVAAQLLDADYCEV
jgi:L-arabinose isomerase